MTYSPASNSNSTFTLLVWKIDFDDSAISSSVPCLKMMKSKAQTEFPSRPRKYLLSSSESTTTVSEGVFKLSVTENNLKIADDNQYNG